MRIKMMTIAVMAIAIGSMVGLIQTAPTEAARKEKVTICHRTNAPKNPYRMITVSKKAVDGQQKNDHTHHTGPVAGSFAEAKSLKADKQKWGDIIPPFDDYAGYNWSAEGQAVYENGCQYPVTTKAKLGFKVVCTPNDTIRVTLTNKGTASGTITVNGTDYELAAKDRQVVRFANQTHVTIVIDGSTVYDQAVICSEGEQPQPEITLTGVCDETTKTFNLTFVNNGDADGTVTVNGTDTVVPAGQTVVVPVFTGNEATKVEVMMNGKLIYSTSVTCIQGGGGGGETPTTPTQPTAPAPQAAAPAEDTLLPNTAGNTDLGVAILTGSLGVAAMLASVVRRFVMAKPF